MRKTTKRITALAGTTALAAAAAAAVTITSASAGPAARQASFRMVPSATAAAAGARCLGSAQASVTIRSQGPVEVMTVSASNLPPNTGFDLFVIQVPNAPFGVSWYQGDLDSNGAGRAAGTFVGRFSVETFVVAPGTAPAPRVHTSPPFPDAASNPSFGPVHTYHLGLWFNSPRDAVKAHCPGTVTPFNGNHTAGVQALSTRNFPPLSGPLRQITP